MATQDAGWSRVLRPQSPARSDVATAAPTSASALSSASLAPRAPTSASPALRGMAPPTIIMRGSTETRAGLFSGVTASAIFDDGWPKLSDVWALARATATVLGKAPSRRVWL